MKARTIGVACVAAALIAGNSSAQTTTSLPPVATSPVNVLLPNYDSVPIGEIGGLEAGAFLVRANDSSAVFYNPAALTRAETTSVSGSAGIFQLGAVGVDAVHASAHSFQQVPAMFAAVVKDALGRSNLAAGVSVARTAAWQQTVDFAHTTETGGTVDRLSYSSASQYDSWLASLGVGYASAKKWRAGASLDLQYTSTERRQTVADQYRTPSVVTALLITSRGEASAAHLRLTLGGQLDLTPHISAGAVVRTRGLGLTSSGLAVFDGQSATGTATTTASFFDDGPDVEFRIPFEVKTGVAITGRRAQAEFDLLVNGGAGEYPLYSSSQSITVVTGPTTGAPSAADFPSSPPVIDLRAVANIAAGGHVNLAEDGSWVLHGGYATSRSPVGPHDTAFTHVDLQKFTAGISGRTKHILGSGGVQYLTGKSDPILLRALPSGQLSTVMKIHSVGLVYSLSVLF